MLAGPLLSRFLDKTLSIYFAAGMLTSNKDCNFWSCFTMSELTGIGGSTFCPMFVIHSTS